MKASRRQILKWGAVGGASLFGVEALAYEPRSIHFKTFEYRVPGLGQNLDGYRIAFITDVHYPRHIAPEYIRETQRVALAWKPDVLLWGGDFVDEYRNDGQKLHTVPSLANLFEATAPEGVYGVLGNHDWWLDGPAVKREIERTTPIRLIDNSHVLLERGGDAFVLGGLGDFWEGAPNLEVAIGGAPRELPRILLSHNPDSAETCLGQEKPGTDVALQISGHTHGGEVNLPIVGPPVIPSAYGRKYERGLVQGRLHPVYVSVGIASPRGIRFRCRPEVTGIVLRSA